MNHNYHTVIMTTLIDLKRHVPRRINAYDEAIAIGDVSAIDFYGCQIDLLDERIEVESAKVESDFDEWD